MGKRGFKCRVGSACELCAAADRQARRAEVVSDVVGLLALVMGTASVIAWAVFLAN